MCGRQSSVREALKQFEERNTPPKFDKQRGKTPEKMLLLLEDDPFASLPIGLDGNFSGGETV